MNIIDRQITTTLDMGRYDLAYMIQVIGEALASTHTKKPHVRIRTTRYINGTVDTELLINDQCLGLPTERVEIEYHQ